VDFQPESKGTLQNTEESHLNPFIVTIDYNMRAFTITAINYLVFLAFSSGGVLQKCVGSFISTFYLVVIPRNGFQDHRLDLHEGVLK